MRNRLIIIAVFVCGFLLIGSSVVAILNPAKSDSVLVMEEEETETIETEKVSTDEYVELDLSELHLLTLAKSGSINQHQLSFFLRQSDISPETPPPNSSFIG